MLKFLKIFYSLSKHQPNLEYRYSIILKARLFDVLYNIYINHLYLRKRICFYIDEKKYSDVSWPFMNYISRNEYF